MHIQAWHEIESIYSLPHVDQEIVEQFSQLKSSQSTHTKSEGNPHHYCAFFLPVHRPSRSIYLCDHIKARDWIPPGGHIEKGETPTQTAVREMEEELAFCPSSSQLTPWDLSVKPIGRPKQGCLTHYDVWFLVELEQQIEFKYDPREYHAAGWFKLKEGVNKIKRNPDFAKIILDLSLA